MSRNSEERILGTEYRIHAIAIKEAEKLQLTTNLFYFSLLDKLYADNHPAKSIVNFRHAVDLSKTEIDQRTIRKHMDSAKEN